MSDDDTNWGDEEDEKIFAFIQESDYMNETVSLIVPKAIPPSSNQDEHLPSLPKRARLDEDAAPHDDDVGHNPTELKVELLAMKQKLGEAVSLNTDLKNKNYQLQGEAATLRRRLDKENSNRQQQIWQRIQAAQDAKTSESEERKKLLQEIESLKHEVGVYRVDIQNLEYNNRKLKRENLSASAMAPDLSSQLNQSSVNSQQSSSQYFTNVSGSIPRNINNLAGPSRDRRFSVRESFYANEVRSARPVAVAPSPAPPPIQLDSKEVQTEEEISPVVEIKKSVDPSNPLSAISIYQQLKTATKRLIALEIQMLKPMAEKTFSKARSTLKKRCTNRTPRFGLGLEAFDSTALMLQWMDQNEMVEFDESEDLHDEHLNRLEQLYNPRALDVYKYPLFEENEEDNEPWEDSEKTLLTAEQDEYLRSDSSSDSSEYEENKKRQSDTSEDEYDIINYDISSNIKQLPLTNFRTLTHSSAQIPLTFYKQYKMKSRLLTHRYNFNYLKNGQPLEVVLESLNGVYDSGGVWNTLYYIKNELRFLFDKTNIYEKTRFHVFITLLVWVKNLWSVIKAVEIQEKVGFGDVYQRELFGWTDILTKIVWRPTKTLVEFCRTIRSYYLSTLSIIVRNGYFNAKRDGFSSVYLILSETIQNPIHHSLENTQWLLEICVGLPRRKIMKYVCRDTLPRKILTKRCLVKDLSERVLAEFKAKQSLELFERFLDFLQFLDEPSPLNMTEAMMAEVKRTKNSMARRKAVKEYCIFKNPEKCECRVAAIENLLIILSEVWILWKERFRELELNDWLGEIQQTNITKKNIYTDVIVRSFEILYGVYKFTDNISQSYGAEAFTIFWNIIASYRRYIYYIPLRPDLESVMKYFTTDMEDELQKHRRGIEFPRRMENEWQEVINSFPHLQMDQFPSQDSSLKTDDDKEN